MKINLEFSVIKYDDRIISACVYDDAYEETIITHSFEMDEISSEDRLVLQLNPLIGKFEESFFLGNMCIFNDLPTIIEDLNLGEKFKHEIIKKEIDFE